MYEFQKMSLQHPKTTFPSSHLVSSLLYPLPAPSLHHQAGHSQGFHGFPSSKNISQHLLHHSPSSFSPFRLAHPSPNSCGFASSILGSCIHDLVGSFFTFGMQKGGPQLGLRYGGVILVIDLYFSYLCRWFLQNEQG